MLPFEVATLGVSVLQRRLAEETVEADNGAAVPFWAVIAIVVSVITVLLCGGTCFVVRCFAPDVTQGPAFEINSYGQEFVKPMGVGDSKSPVVHANADSSYPGAIPVHNPNNDKYDVNNPSVHRRPENFEHPNSNREERQTVLDRLNGRMLPRGHGA